MGWGWQWASGWSGDEPGWVAYCNACGTPMLDDLIGEDLPVWEDVFGALNWAADDHATRAHIDHTDAVYIAIQVTKKEGSKHSHGS